MLGTILQLTRTKGTWQSTEFIFHWSFCLVTAFISLNLDSNSQALQFISTQVLVTPTWIRFVVMYLSPIAPYVPDFVLSVLIKEHFSSPSSPSKEEVVQEKAMVHLWGTDGIHSSQFPNPTTYWPSVKTEGPIPQRLPQQREEKRALHWNSWDELRFVWKGHPSSLISISRTDRQLSAVS